MKIYHLVPKYSQFVPQGSLIVPLLKVREMPRKPGYSMKVLITKKNFPSIGSKKLCAPILQENSANYNSLETLINLDFGKNFAVFFLIPQTKIAKMMAKMTMRHNFNQVNELIGYQNSADFIEIWPDHSLDVVKPKSVGDFGNS